MLHSFRYSMNTKGRYRFLAQAAILQKHGLVLTSVYGLFAGQSGGVLGNRILSLEIYTDSQGGRQVLWTTGVS